MDSEIKFINGIRLALCVLRFIFMKMQWPWQAITYVQQTEFIIKTVYILNHRNKTVQNNTIFYVSL